MDLLLEKLLKSFSTSGSEEEIKDVIKNELNNLSIGYEEDKMGNLIVKFSNNSMIDSSNINNIDEVEKFMLCTHMDSIGFITTFIEENGVIRVAPIGKFNINKILNSTVIFENGAIGKLCSLKNNPSFEEVFVDIGVNSKKEANKQVKVGESAIIKSDFIEKDDVIIAPGLNPKIGCYALFKVIEKLKNNNIKTNKELYIVFSTQGELEGRGARAVSNLIKPDYSIVLNLEEESKNNNFKLGKGCAIKVLDKSLIIHHEIKELLEKTFDKLNLKTKYLVYDNSTEGGTIHKECNGSKTGVLSIPCRYKNSNQEIIDKNDIKEAIDILMEVINLI